MAAALASRFAQLVRQVVEAGGGRVVELRGDEALVVFTSARQALRSAIALQKRARQEPFGAHESLHIGIGLDAGEAVPVEEGFRGSALNVAARLCAQAHPGEVLASATVTNLAGPLHEIQYLDKGTAHLKGMPRPTQLFLVRNTNEEAYEIVESTVPNKTQELPAGGFLGSLPSASLVGRSHLMAELCEIIDDVSAGNGRLVMLAGEPGTGKTRLAQEVTVEVNARGFVIAAGACYDTRQSSGYFPFTTILSGLYELAPVDTRDMVNRQWGALSHLIPIIPSLELDNNNGHQGQDRLFWMASRFVETMSSSRPLAILIDDLHWADASSLELLRYLAHAARSLPVLLLATYRDTELTPGSSLEALLRDLRREQLVSTIAVDPLDVTRTRDLVASLVGPGGVSNTLGQLIYERTEGNPFFIQQIVSMMSERGQTNWSLESADSAKCLVTEVPSTVRAVTLQRLSRLDNNTQEILRLASIFGQTFMFDDLLELCSEQSEERLLTFEVDEDRLDSVIRAAAEISLVRVENSDLCAFDHLLTQECLYQELSARRRRRLHRAAAAIISQSATAALRATQAANHYLQAGEPSRALPLVLAAAQRAAGLSAHIEAETHFRTAVNVAREIDDAESLPIGAEGLGETLMLTGRCIEGAEQLEMATDVYAHRGDEPARIRLSVRRALALTLGQRVGEALALLESILASPAMRSHPRLLGQAYAVQARCYLSLDRPDKQVQSAAKSEQLSRESGDLQTLASALIDRATGASALGETDQVLPLLMEAAEIAQELNDDLLLSRALNDAAVCSWHEVGLDAAEGYHRRALEAAERSGSPSSIAHGRAVLGMCSWMRGEWTEASHWFESAATTAGSLRLSSAGWTMSNPGWLLALKGKEDMATRMLEECIGRAQAQDDMLLLLWAKLRLAEQHLIQGRPRKAATLTSEALCRSDVHGWHRRQWLLIGIQAALDMRDIAGAREQLDELPSERWGEPWFSVSYPRLVASCLALEGNHEESDKVFSEALQRALDLPTRPGQADVLRSWGEADLMAKRKELAAKRLRESHDIYRELGARPMMDAVEVELLSLGLHARKHR